MATDFWLPALTSAVNYSFPGGGVIKVCLLRCNKCWDQISCGRAVERGVSLIMIMIIQRDCIGHVKYDVEK